MKRHTGVEYADQAKNMGAKIITWKDEQGKIVNYEIKAPKGGSIVVPPGELRPSMDGFVRRLFKILLILALPLLGLLSVLARL